MFCFSARCAAVRRDCCTPLACAPQSNRLTDALGSSASSNGESKRVLSRPVARLHTRAGHMTPRVIVQGMARACVCVHSTQGASLAKEDLIEMHGKVEEVLPDSRFRVTL